MNRVLRILVVVRRFHPNLSQFDAALRAVGCEITYLVSAVGPSERKTSSRLLHVPDGELGIRRAISILDECSPNLIVVREYKSDRKVIGLLARVRGIRMIGYSQSEVVVGHEGAAINAFVQDFKRISINLLTRAKGMPFKIISPVKYRERSRWHQPGFVYVPWVAPSPVEDSLGRNGEVPTILSVGKLYQERKRQDWLIKFLQEWPGPLTLILVGSGDPAVGQSSFSHYSALMNSAESLSPDKRLEIMRDLDWNGMSETYRRSDLFVSAAKGEIFGYSALEALSFGLPVILGSRDGARSYVEDANAGLVYDENSYEDFYAKMSSALGSLQNRVKWGQNAITFSRTVLSPENFVRNLSAAIKLDFGAA